MVLSLIVAACCSVIQSSATPAVSVSLVADAGLQTEICGILRRELRWGPPNFGEKPESDSKFDAWIVNLEKPVQVDLGAELGKRHVEMLSHIQVTLPTAQQPVLDSLEGTEVFATGRLWTATSQGDVTPAVLAVTKIERADSSCRRHRG